MSLLPITNAYNTAADVHMCNYLAAFRSVQRTHSFFFFFPFVRSRCGVSPCLYFCLFFLPFCTHTILSLSNHFTSFTCLADALPFPDSHMFILLSYAFLLLFNDTHRSTLELDQVAAKTFSSFSLFLLSLLSQGTSVLLSVKHRHT